MELFQYTHAIVCRISDSWCSKSLGATTSLNLEKARRQHRNYVDCLRKLKIDVIELPADENYPDSVYVEDTAVICNGLALITKPGHFTRRKETEYIKTTLKKELHLPIIEIMEENASLDGGDVLFTGKEFFVGIANRTNELGAKAVASAFPEFPCTPIKLADALHLKSLISMAGPNILSVGSSPQAQSLLKQIERYSMFQYTTLTVPDDCAANCLFVNGTLIYRSADEFPNSAKVFAERIPYILQPIDYSEVAKPQAALTCCSLLIFKS